MSYDFHWFLQPHPLPLPLLLKFTGLLKISSNIFLPWGLCKCFWGVLFFLVLVQLTQILLVSLKYLSPVFISSGKPPLVYLRFCVFMFLSFITCLSLKLHVNFCEYLIKFCLHLQTLKFMRTNIVLIFAYFRLIYNRFSRNIVWWGTSVAQTVKPLTLGLGPGPDLRVMRSGSALS